MFPSTYATPQKALVTYFTVSVTLPNWVLPRKMQLRAFGVPNETLRDVAVTAKGNVTEKGCYIDSSALAERFSMYVKRHLESKYGIRLIGIRINTVTTHHQGVSIKIQRESEAIEVLLDEIGG